MELKIYPKKIVIILFCLFLAYNIGISLIVMTSNETMAIMIFAAFFVVTTLLVIMNFFLHKITLTQKWLLIREDGTKGIKKYKIPLRSIQKTECIEVKLGFASDKVFNIHYVDSQIIKVHRVNQNLYFIKDLQHLFEYMEQNLNIQYDRH
jgi:hypothetical protein